MARPPDKPSSNATPVFQDEYFTVFVDERMRIVRTVRSEKPLPGVELLDGVITRLAKALDGLGRSRYAILSDLRASPGRNDPDFEAAMERLRPLWVGGFRKSGVLVRTSVGQMQIHRHARRDGVKRMISRDEDELLKYLTQDEP